MNETLAVALQYFAGGGGFGASLIFFRWLANFIAGRVDKRDERLDKNTHELIEMLRQQVSDLLARETITLKRLDAAEEELAKCKELHANERAERLRFERLLQAQGDVANQVQTIVAAERVEAKKG